MEYCAQLRIKQKLFINNNTNSLVLSLFILILNNLLSVSSTSTSLSWSSDDLKDFVEATPLTYASKFCILYTFLPYV